MLGGLLIILLSGLLSFALIHRMKRRHRFIETKTLKLMFFYHILISLVYYLYARFNPSDSKAYYAKVEMNYRGENWTDFYGTSTTFIEFLGFPFIKFFAFSYEAVMATFAFIGFLGFVYFYIFFRENIRFKHTFLGFNLLTLIFFLPNLHFWSASLGKGSVIFFGLALFFYGISRLDKRIPAVLIGGLIIYHVRPHIMLVILVSALIGFMFSARSIAWSWRLLFLVGASAAFFFIYQDVLLMVGIDEEELFTEGLDLAHRATELTKATSGVAIQTYTLPMQLFTFLYRPLFFDAPGVFGLIVSVENVFYLVISLGLLASVKGLRFIFTSGFLTKTSFIGFFAVALALSQISGNLGLAMRQKSQVMILLLFVVLAFRDHQKAASLMRTKRRRPVVSPVTQVVVTPER